MPHAFRPPVLILLAALCGARWGGQGSALWLGMALILLVASTRGRKTGAPLLPSASEPPPRWGWARGAVAVAVLLGGIGELHLASVSRRWSERVERWEVQTQGQLARSLDQLLLANERAADRLLGQLSGRPLGPDLVLPTGKWTQGVDALAVFNSAGQLLAWEGGHQGPIPRPVRLGLSPYVYEEGALFGYLYVTRALPGGAGTVVSASLMRADLPPSLEDIRADFVSRFRQDHRAQILLSRADRVEGESVWDLRWEDQVLFSVTLVPPTEAEIRTDLERKWGRAGVFFLLLTWGLLAYQIRRIPGLRALFAVGALALLAAVPLGFLLSLPRIFSPADFLLPGPWPLTLGDLLVVAGVAVFALGWMEAGPEGPRPGGPQNGEGGGWKAASWTSAGVRAALATGFVALLLGGVERGASRDLLAGPEWLWVGMLGGVGFLATVGVGLCLRGRLGPSRSRSALRPLAGVSRLHGLALLLALILSSGAAFWVRNAAGFPLLLVGFWAIPFSFLARGGLGARGWTLGVLRWSLLSSLTFSLVLPWAWGGRLEAGIEAAEERMKRLGTEADPFLEFLLLRTGEQAADLSATGRNPVEVLYSAWTGSGMAEEGVALWLTWWSPDGIPQEELRIGVPATRPPVPVDLLRRAREGEGVVVERVDRADAHYLAATPLARGAILTAVVPPRRALSAGSPLGPLFSPAQTDSDPLVLVPLLPGEAVSARSGVQWQATSEGWRGESFVAHPDQVYQGHYVLALPGPFLLTARATLLLLAAVSLGLLLWTAGWKFAGGGEGGVDRARAFLGSFRGRVTLALFAFFLTPTLLFGTLAYRTLAGASVRTAEVLAERAVEEASIRFPDSGETMNVLASRVGSDLLLYEGGQLVAGSLRELVELGLYEGWLPHDIHRSMAQGDLLMTTASAALGGYEYVVAYRRLPGGGVLAAPAPLQAGASAIRQREVADLLAFALLLGAGLSVLLALGVGRALYRPIQILQVASERVGAGNMGVHLPSDRMDEFGSVFGAFNRMVDRLALTRRALIRSSRRTRAIVEEVATGVIALDPQGRVTLVNPQAGELLGVELLPNHPLPTSDVEDSVTALSRWFDSAMEGGATEAGTELVLGDRRVRVRARRISRRGPSGGTVLSLEDVTDELRTERVLAWGEMAQQVAHEVKNPLTPIKLGIQHIRRAWEDGREDFGDILTRNVNAILREIDRLAAVATSFSRFAAPSPTGTTPLQKVEVGRVVADVLALYAAAEGPVEFGSEIQPGLPPVWARATELQEVLVNLLENARAALPQGGWVRIRARSGPGGLLQLEVQDNGSGIPKELQGRVFEPHFSTRSTGSGLGLAIVRRLVESWGGRVWVESRSGGGTTVRLLLSPISLKPAPVESEPEPVREDVRG